MTPIRAGTPYGEERDLRHHARATRLCRRHSPPGRRSRQPEGGDDADHRSSSDCKGVGRRERAVSFDSCAHWTTCRRVIRHDEQALTELRDAAVVRLEAYGDDRGFRRAASCTTSTPPSQASTGRTAIAGVALFAGTDITHVVPLEVTVEPRIVVGERFALAELVTDNAREVHARVLVLSLAKTRCIDVTRRIACERHDAGFPIEVEAPTREETPHRDFALDEHEHEEAARYVLRAVDAALKKVHEADPRPIVLMGAERDLSYWDEVSTIAGDRDRAGARQLRDGPDSRRSCPGVTPASRVAPARARARSST